MRFLLDTNAVIAMHKHQGFRTKLQQHHVADIAISVITQYELYYGAFNGSSQHLSANLLRIESIPFTTLTFTPEDAKRAAIVRAATKNQPIGSYDILIAAQALERDLILVTHNTREFMRVPKLRLEDWL
ncbi:MAG: PIN domain-containing protein [Moraxellaceae bacterium]|nr:PIN domain-containing protein [Pseudomonadales bacterium]MCB1674247.1 PIN domain-containing protein [Pseudomonadales bacterium]MCP5174690.1 PIN domain-containing protein [Moraxellaceae bacterium]MCP5177406.1 PIN domain-containing protein [Moraxellaceae bacterium]